MVTVTGDTPEENKRCLPSPIFGMMTCKAQEEVVGSEVARHREVVVVPGSGHPMNGKGPKEITPSCGTLNLLSPVLRLLVIFWSSLVKTLKCSCLLPSILVPLRFSRLQAKGPQSKHRFFSVSSTLCL